MSPSDLLQRLLDAAFVRADTAALEDLIDPGADVFDTHLAAPSRAAFLDCVQSLCGALDDRDLTIFAGIADDSRALGQFRLRATHLGVAWGVVPAGRRIDLAASTSIVVRGGRVVVLRNTWATAHLLGEFGLRDPEAPWVELYRTEPRCHDAPRLLDGEPHRTRWARAWNLSPFLARTAVLVMAGLDASAMADVLGVTTSSVRTYVREVYAATGVHGRIALLRGAREIG